LDHSVELIEVMSAKLQDIVFIIYQETALLRWSWLLLRSFQWFIFRRGLLLSSFAIPCGLLGLS
jgi:hypothetical protein